MSKIFYTYLHCYPETNVPFYVGKGFGKRAIRMVGRNKEHREIINALGGIKNIKTIKYYTENEEKALELEAELIYMLQKLLNINLVNKTTGGQGWSHSEETKNLIRSIHKGKIPSLATKEAQIKACTGKSLSKEHKEKLRIKSTGKIFTYESRKKISLSKLGKSRSEETKRKLSLFMTGLKRSPYKKKLKEGLNGQ